MSFNAARRNKNRNLNNANYGSAPSKIDKPNRMKNTNDKTQGPNRYDGIYSNPEFMYANTSLIGTLANIVHKDGQIYEGVFNTFSSDHEIVLNTVSRVVPKAETNVVGPNVGSLLASLSAKNEFLDTVIFELKDIVMMSIPNVNLDFALKGNFTDTEISKFNPNLLAKERHLVPWDCADDGLDDSLGDSLMLNDDGDIGWNADDMFKLHEKKYNMATTYTESMEGYTVPLDKNAEDYEEHEAEANRIVQLIENDVASKDRLAKEDGDEEDQFSAVIRPEPNEHNPPQNVHVNKQTNYNQNNQNAINQSYSRHDNLNNRGGRNKNNTSANMSNTSSNFSSNNSLNRSKNQTMSNSGPLQQSQSYHSFSSRSNGPMNNNRINSRLDQQHNHHEEKDLHHRNERLMHNDQSSSQNLPPQRSQHNNNSNNRRLNNPPSMMQKRDETTHDLKKFSSNFKMAIPSQANQESDNRDTVNKELAKEVKQLNLNKSADIKDQNVNNQNKINDQPSSSSTSNKSTNNNRKDNEVSQVVKPANKPLLDKPPKDKSPSYIDKPVSVNQNEPDTSSVEKINNNKQQQQQQTKPDHQIKPVEPSQQPQQSSESTTTATPTGKQHPDTEQTIQDNAKQERDSESTKQPTPDTSGSQSQADSSKGLATNESQNSDKAIKKSTLNPNAKEFVFNPKASPYTPKAFVSPAIYPPPAMNADLPLPLSTMPPNANVNPQLAFQPNAHQHLAGHPNAAMHGQPTAGSAAIPHPANQIQQQMPLSQIVPVPQGGNQQLITSVLHPQQPLMAHHPAGAQVHHHQMHQGAHQMLPFPTHLMSQSIQFAVQTNPQNSMHHHPHPQNAHHSHHQTSPYIIPAVPNQVSTASLPPNAQLTSVTSNQIVSYGPGGPASMAHQPSNPPPNASLVNSQQASGGQPNQPPSNSGAGPRGSRNKAGQYHNNNQSGNVNQRSNQSNPPSNTNQPPMGNLNQPNMQNAHVVSASGPTAVYSQQPIHLTPNFSSPPTGVNPGTYQIYHHPQFQAHQHPHQTTRLMSPQSLGMLHHPGMTAAYPTNEHPAFQQVYANYMTNMAGVPQFVAMPPASPSPIHLSHGSNTMINNIGAPVVVSTHLNTSGGQKNVQRSSSNNTSSTSNGSPTSQQLSASQQTTQPQQMINNGAGQYAQNAMMPFIIAQPNLHGVSNDHQTPPPN